MFCVLCFFLLSFSFFSIYFLNLSVLLVLFLLFLFRFCFRAWFLFLSGIVFVFAFVFAVVFLFCFRFSFFFPFFFQRVPARWVFEPFEPFDPFKPFYSSCSEGQREEEQGGEAPHDEQRVRERVRTKADRGGSGACAWNIYAVMFSGR